MLTEMIRFITQTGAGEMPRSASNITTQRAHSTMNGPETTPDTKRKVGRPLNETAKYAATLGVGERSIRRLGGMEYVKALPEEIRSMYIEQTKARGIEMRSQKDDARRRSTEKRRIR